MGREVRPRGRGQVRKRLRDAAPAAPAAARPNGTRRRPSAVAARRTRSRVGGISRTARRCR